MQAVAHGIELLLKERLRRIHPALLWENVDKYPNLDARTVTSEGALNRLVNIGGLVFSKEDADIIKSLRTTRNAIEHYAWTTTKQEADRIVGGALAFAFEFAGMHLKISFFGYHSRKDDTLKCLLDANPYFATAFSIRQARRFDESPAGAHECSFCRAVDVLDAKGTCLRCGHVSNVEFMPDIDDEIPF